MITKEWFDQAVDHYKEMNRALEEFTDVYVGHFGGDREHVTHFEVCGDTINFETESYHCSCCGPDYHSFNIPVSYLWDEKWHDKEDEKRKAELKEQLRKRAVKEKEEKQKASTWRKAQYEKLKEEFENENN